MPGKTETNFKVVADNRKEVGIVYDKDNNQHTGTLDIDGSTTDFVHSITLTVAPGNRHIFHVYALLTDRRDALQQFLAERGVPTIIYYPRPLHLQKVYAECGWREGDFPVAERLAHRTLALPFFERIMGSVIGKMRGAAPA